MIRKHFAGFAASALALAVSAQAFAGTVTTDGADLVIKTKGGLEVGTTDKEFSFKINGRLQADADSFDGFYTQNGERADETYLRRARLEISGVAFTDWGYTFQRNFGDDSSNWRELAIHYNGWEPVQISVGRIRPTFGLEWATSSKWITAIERSALSDLAPWVNSEDGEGIRVRTTVGMFHGEAGAYRQDGGDGVDMLEDEDGANNTSFVLRGVIAPIVEKDQVLHLGANFGKRDLEEGYLERIRPRLSVRGTTEDSANGNRATFGGTRTDGTDQAWGLEAAYMIGPFSVQGEYLTRTVDGMEGFEDLEATGYNVQLAYTLTGESRSYKLDGGKFDKIKPENKRTGAWEVFYRYDHLSVDDNNGAFADIGDVEAKVHNLGVNWYVNDAVKISAAYVKAKTDKITNNNGDDDGDGFVTRLQYVF